MREIKFRAWDGRRMWFASLEDLRYDIGSQGAGDWSLEEQVGEETAGFTGRRYDQNSKGMVYMEYTGLKDKNGVEIFEGDIIRRHVSWASGRLEEVRYDNGSWSYSYDLVEYVEKPDAQWEVIGNVYETPDLISSEELPE